MLKKWLAFGPHAPSTIVPSWLWPESAIDDNSVGDDGHDDVDEDEDDAEVEDEEEDQQNGFGKEQPEAVGAPASAAEQDEDDMEDDTTGDSPPSSFCPACSRPHVPSASCSPPAWAIDTSLSMTTSYTHANSHQFSSATHSRSRSSSTVSFSSSYSSSSSSSTRRSSASTGLSSNNSSSSATTITTRRASEARVSAAHDDGSPTTNTANLSPAAASSASRKNKKQHLGAQDNKPKKRRRAVKVTARDISAWAAEIAQNAADSALDLLRASCGQWCTGGVITPDEYGVMHHIAHGWQLVEPFADFYQMQEPLLEDTVLVVPKPAQSSSSISGSAPSPSRFAASRNAPAPPLSGSSREPQRGLSSSTPSSSTHSSSTPSSSTCALQSSSSHGLLSAAPTRPTRRATTFRDAARSLLAHHGVGIGCPGCRHSKCKKRKHDEQTLLKNLMQRLGQLVPCGSQHDDGSNCTTADLTKWLSMDLVEQYKAQQRELDDIYLGLGNLSMTVLLRSLHAVTEFPVELMHMVDAYLGATLTDVLKLLLDQAAQAVCANVHANFDSLMRSSVLPFYSMLTRRLTKYTKHQPMEIRKEYPGSKRVHCAYDFVRVGGDQWCAVVNNLGPVDKPKTSKELTFSPSWSAASLIYPLVHGHTSTIQSQLRTLWATNTLGTKNPKLLAIVD